MTKEEYISENGEQINKITSLSREKRVFSPKVPFARRAHIKSMAQYQKMYNESVKNPEKFWAKIAEELYWFKKMEKSAELEIAPLKMVYQRKIKHEL